MSDALAKNNNDDDDENDEVYNDNEKQQGIDAEDDDYDQNQEDDLVVEEEGDDVEMENNNQNDESGQVDDEDTDAFDDNKNSEEGGDADDEDAQNTDGEVLDVSSTSGIADVERSNRVDKRRKAATTTKGTHPRKGLKGPRGRKNSGVGGRAPSVRGLTIPFRTIKKSMKLDPDIPIVQNEAAIMATVAVELFLKRLVTQSYRNAKNRGRNTVRYEDVAEARTSDKALAFLETLIP
jgi:histone H3/H4